MLFYSNNQGLQFQFFIYFQVTFLLLNVIKVLKAALLVQVVPSSKASSQINTSSIVGKCSSSDIVRTTTMTEANLPNVIDLATSWAQNDPNDRTSAYIQNLIQNVNNSDSSGDTSKNQSKDDKKALEALFPTDGSRIGFGTAGLRSAMKPGPLGMNDLVIVQATQGLAKYCQQVQSNNEVDGEATKKLIAVIGYDHRAKPEFDLSSKSFALLTKLVFLHAGFDCILLDGLVPTPLVAYSTTALGAAVGIMITASHNPKNDAGRYLS